MGCAFSLCFHKTLSIIKNAVHFVCNLFGLCDYDVCFSTRSYYILKMRLRCLIMFVAIYIRKHQHATFSIIF